MIDFPRFNIGGSTPATPAGSNILGQGLAWLTDQLREHASEAVTYARGDASVDVQATLGSKLLKLDDGDGGIRMERTDMDFLVRASDLDFGGGPVRPQRGDVVYLPVGGTLQVFEVVPYGGSDGPWRWADPHQSMLRIHAKHVGEEPYS